MKTSADVIHVRMQLFVSVEIVYYCIYFFNRYCTSLLLRTTTWQEVFKEELENRASEWNPFEEGHRYETFRPEERVSFLSCLFALTSDVGVLFDVL